MHQMVRGEAIASLMKYFVYIITNKFNTVLYIGVTNNLIRRIYEHRNKIVLGFSSKYNIFKLVYYEMYSSPQDAIIREKMLKNLVRRKKDALITQFNPNWKDLYDEIL